MRRVILITFLFCIVFYAGSGQQKNTSGVKIFFQGLVMDAETLSPISNSQIMINRTFSSVSNLDGSFSLYVNRKDTVVFKSLGYKSTVLQISDTLSGNEFIAGIFMKSDTVSIGEVVIIPRITNLKSEIMNSRSNKPANFDNAKYNVAISAYQGRNTNSGYNDPAYNYSILSHRQKIKAFERGGIPSDQIAGINSLLLVPAAILLIKGMPEKPAPMIPDLTESELYLLQKTYLESLKSHK